MEGCWPIARESCTKRRMTSTSTGFKGAAPVLFSMEFRFTRRKHGNAPK